MKTCTYFVLASFLLALAGHATAAENVSQSQASVLNADLMAIGTGKSETTWLVGGTDGRLLRSDDQGQSWHQASIDGKYQIVQIVSRPHAQTLAVAQESLLRSDDDGLHWQVIDLPAGQRASRVLYHAGSRQWVATSMNGSILTSRDDGHSWTVVYHQPDDAPLTAIAGADSGFLLAAGAGGRLVYSPDGKQWKDLPTDTTAPVTRLLELPGRHEILSFWADSSVIAIPASGKRAIRRVTPSTEVPYTVAYDKVHRQALMATTKGNLFRTSNGGSTWQDLGSLDNILLTGILPDPQDGSLTAIGARGLIARSTDAGRHWNIITNNHWGATLNTAMRTSDGKLLIAAGTGGLLSRSTDHGVTWETTEEHLKYYIQDIVPTPDQQAVLAIGEQGVVLRSTDTGETWTRIRTGMKMDVSLFSVLEHPRTHELMMVGPVGTFLSSADNGLSWQVREPIEEAGEGYLRQLVADDSTGALLAVASPGIVVRSDDAGKTWQTTDANNGNKGMGSAVSLGQHIFLASRSNGEILRSTDDGRHWVPTTVNNAAPGYLHAEPATGLAWIMAHDAMYRTTDRGETWQRSKLPDITVNFMLRTAAGTLLGFGNGGAILRSTDDGEHWAGVASGTHSSLRKPIMDHAHGRIFVPGRDGTLLVSNDDGLHWQGIETNTSAHLNRLWLSKDGKTLLVTGERIVRVSLP